jgi:TatD DNase family protein
MNLVDTHAHINIMIADGFDKPLPHNFKELSEPIIKEAAAHEVTTLINVGTSLQESINSIQLAKTFDNCFATVGIHPTDVKETWQADLSVLEKLAQDKNNKVVGVGEIGLDYYRPGFNKILQSVALRAQIEMALRNDLAIVIHTRTAGQEVLTVLEEYKNHKNLRGIIHCFSEDMAFAQRALEIGFVLGIGGPLTYPKNETLREVFKTVPLKKIVLETDAPFLPPQIIRGKKNSPAQIKTIATFLAELRGCSIEEVAEITTNNALMVFRI